MTGLVSITPRRAIPLLLDHLQAKESVMLWGPAGCAKSDVARILAAQGFDGNLIDCRLAYHGPEDFHLPVPNMETKTTDWYPDSRYIPNVELHGERGILLLDEVTNCNGSQQNIAYQIALDREFCGTPIPPGWAVMLAGNRTGDRGNSFSMASPLANRLQHFEFNPLDPDLRKEWSDDYAAYCAENNSNPMVSAYIQFQPEALYVLPGAGQVAFPSLRSWTKLAAACDRYEARGELPPAPVVSGRIGQSQAVSFQAFMAHKDQVPTFAEIVADPIHARCPNMKKETGGLGACFFVVGMLCHKMTGANFDQVAKYLARLPDELNASAVGLMSKAKRQEILITRAGQKWLTDNQSIIA